MNKSMRLLGILLCISVTVSGCQSTDYNQTSLSVEATRDTTSKQLSVQEEMQLEGLDQEVIKGLERLGYSEKRLSEIWQVLEGKGDKHFFASLLLGGEEHYLEAFATDPNDLSAEITVLMAEYAKHLLDSGDLASLISLNNALLGAKKNFFDVMPDGSRFESTKLYRDIYLERMYAGTSVRMKTDTILLAAMEEDIAESGVTPQAYKELKQKQTLELNLGGYWASQSILVHRQGIHANDDWFQIVDIINNGRDEGAVDYHMAYYSSDSMKWEEAEVNSSILSSMELSDAWNRREDKNGRSAAQNPGTDLVTTLTGKKELAAVDFKVPELVILSTAMSLRNNDNATVVLGLEALEDYRHQKTGVMGFIAEDDKLLNGVIQLQTLETGISAKTFKEMMKRFGKGSLCYIDEQGGISTAGFCEPLLLYRLQQLQSQGLGAMAGWNEAQRGFIDTKIEEHIKDDNERLLLCKMLVSGGYELLEPNGEGYKAKDMELFQDAIRTLELLIADNPELSLDSSGGIWDNFGGS